MQDPLSEIKDSHYINFWESKNDNPKAPLMTIVLKDKKTGTQVKYPIWRDKEKGYPYLGKPEAIEAQATKKPYEGKVTKDVAGIYDDFESDCPF